MPIPLIDKIKPANGGGFPMVDAQDVAMPDGKRLSEWEASLPINGTPQVGQVLRVAEVDENGEVKALEAVIFSANIVFMTQEQYEVYRVSADYDPNQTVGILTEDTRV